MPDCFHGAELLASLGAAELRLALFGAAESLFPSDLMVLVEMIKL